MKLIAKHLPLLALALLVCSTELRAEDFPFKVGDVVKVQLKDGAFKAGGAGYKITNIRGKWVEVEITDDLRQWINTDNILSLTPVQ